MRQSLKEDIKLCYKILLDISDMRNAEDTISSYWAIEKFNKDLDELKDRFNIIFITIVEDIRSLPLIQRSTIEARFTPLMSTMNS